MSAPAFDELLPPAARGRDEYRIARTHRSAGAEHNERREFLGDAVLGLVVSELLYRRFPEASEGDLTRLRSHLVSRAMLEELARERRLAERLVCAPELPARARAAVAGNALEAVVAAVYEVCGLDEARRFVERLYGPRLDALPAPDALRSPKARLQELLQERGQPRPEYALVRERPDGEPRFEVECAVPALGLRERGGGARVRLAEAAAAAAALASIRRRWPEWTA